jgi:hypothetical protein
MSNLEKDDGSKILDVIDTFDNQNNIEPSLKFINQDLNQTYGSLEDLNLKSKPKPIPIPIPIKTTENVNFNITNEKNYFNLENDPNFSIYVENKIKNTPPREDLLEQHINSIYPKATNEWVDSDLVIKCQACSVVFTWYYRKHHCRACGGVYCSNCCNKYAVIPKKLIEVPKESKILTIQAKQVLTKLTGTVSNLTVGMVSKQQSSNKQIINETSLVCNDCYYKINKLLDIQHIIKICEYLDLPDLYNVIRINKQWCNAGIHCISLFRNIQYKPIDHIFNKWECSMIGSLYEKLNGHNNWFLIWIKTSLVNLIVYNDKNIEEILANIKKYSEEKTVNCWNLMCSRKCNLKLDILDGLEIIKYISDIPNYNVIFWDNLKLQEVIIETIKKIIELNKKSKLIYQSIPFLTTSLRYLIKDSFIDYSSFINKLLDEICGNDENLLTLLCFEYNYLKTLISSDPSIVQISQIFHLYLTSKLSPLHKKIVTRTINTFVKIIDDKKISPQLELPILYPFEPSYFITEILSITEFQSNSKPILVKVNVQKSFNKKMGEKVEKKFIIKNDCQLRKENIVSSLIILLQDKLIQQSERDRIDYFEPIPTYQIIMINNQIGIIEFLDSCLTLKNISMKNYTLQNYILENNKDVKIGVIKERFAKSLAISSCLSYVLGLGDRHAQNIMVSNSGQIIHIDYGYILENPLHSNIVNNPVIRISTEMIDFLGGWNSEYYNLFKTYTIQVFDIFRLYSNLIINFYNILGYEKIMDWDKFKKRLTDRFMNGLAYKDIEVVLLDVIESSTKSYGGVFIDLCNEYGSMFKGWF